MLEAKQAKPVHAGQATPLPVASRQVAACRGATWTTALVKIAVLLVLIAIVAVSTGPLLGFFIIVCLIAAAGESE